MYGATGAKSRLLHLFVGTIGGEKNRAKPPIRFRIYFAVEDHAIPSRRTKSGELMDWKFRTEYPTLMPPS
jgi:hypothetical protein